METIVLSSFVSALKFKTEQDDTLMWCPIRKKFLHKTPEEMIRQLWIQFLLDKEVSLKKIQAEKQFKVRDKNRRFDLLLFNSQSEASVLFEFKSFNEVIDAKVVSQISLYNLALKAPYLVISNGQEHHFGKVDFENQRYTAYNDFNQILKQL